MDDIAKQYPDFKFTADIPETSKGIKLEMFNILGSTPKRMHFKNKKKVDPIWRDWIITENPNLPDKTHEFPIPNLAAAHAGINKYAKYDVEIPLYKLELAMNIVDDMLGPHLRGYEVNLDKQAVFSTINMQSSMGWPESALGIKADEYFKDFKNFEKEWEKAMDPNWIPIGTSALKEEGRPLEKVLSNSIRQMTAMQKNQSIRGTALYGKLHDKMHAMHHIGPSFVGGSPFYAEWDELFRRLDVHPNADETDAVQWDSSIRAKMLWAASMLRWLWMSDECKTPHIRAVHVAYYKHLIYTVVMSPEGMLFIKKLGMPSGALTTLDDNTLILLLAIVMIFISVTPAKYHSANAFRAHVELALTGDDNTFTFSDEIKPYFNGEILCEKMMELTGINFERAHARSQVRLSECSFLSCKFLDTEFGLKVPLFDTSKFLTSIKYTNIRTPQMTLQRAATFRIVGYWDPKFRGFMEQYIDFIIRTYDQTLQHDKDWQTARSLVWGKHRILKLYFGFQSNLVGNDDKAYKAQPKYYNNILVNPSGYKTSELENKDLIEAHTTKGHILMSQQQTHPHPVKERLEKKVIKKAVKAEAKAVRKELKKDANTAAVLAKIKSNPSTHSSYQKAKKDPVFMRYFGSLINPDLADPCGVPDGYPVPTGVQKSIQTFDVIGNYNATSITNGDGGRFCFHIAPNIGHGMTQNDGYIAVTNTYTNMSNDDVTPEQTFQYVLGTKAAAILPSVVWAPGYVSVSLSEKAEREAKLKKRKSVDLSKLSSTTSSKDSAKDETPDKPDHVKEVDEIRSTSKIVLGKVKKRHNHRMVSDFTNAAYEYWQDTLSDFLAGTNAAGLGINDLGGTATQIRPVAMSAWFQCGKSELDDAGYVTAALLPAGSTTGQIIPLDWNAGAAANDFTGYGPLQNWENLSEVPGSTYNGKLRDGAYVIWTPQRISDNEMNAPQFSDLEDFPTIMICGQWSPNAGQTVNAASSLLGRLRVVTHYEFTSESQNASLAYRGCTTDVLQRIKLLMHGNSCAMANGDHAEWIKKMLAAAGGGAIGFLLGGPAGAAEGGMAGYALAKKYLSK